MKRILFVILALIAAFAGIAIYNNNPRSVVAKLIKQGDLNPQRLRYQVCLLGFIPLAEAVFESDKTETFEGRQVYHLAANARTLKLISYFFEGRAAIDSYIDIEEYNPVLFRQKLMVKGKPDILKEARYDQKNGIMSIANSQRQILPNTQDPLSVIFNLKRMDFGQTKDFKMNLNTNQKNYTLDAKAEEKGLVIGGKTYKLILLTAQVYRQDKNPYHRSHISMALLKDKRNTPVFIKVFAGGFPISARLVEAK